MEQAWDLLWSIFGGGAVVALAVIIFIMLMIAYSGLLVWGLTLMGHV